jgi:hypothetical protein
MMSCSKEQHTKKPKAVFIIVDGIPADVIEELNPPTLQEIRNIGGYSRCFVGGNKSTYNETPTISAPGYMSLITGTWGNKHNVWDNDVAAPNYNYWNIFRIAEKSDSSLKTAIFSTWEDNRTKLLGEGLDQAGSLMLDYRFDGLERDTLKYPHDNEAAYILNIDEAVTTEAARYILTEGPDVSWIYLEYTDDMGHRFGDSPRFHDAIMKADLQIKKVWDAIKTRETSNAEDWLLVVTTDHGRNASTGKDHGGQSDRERTTWIVTNENNLNDRFKNGPAVVDILPSICNHLGLKIPEEVKNEIDGVPFIGGLDLANLTGEKNGNNIQLRWKNFNPDKSVKADVFLTTTNNFNNGSIDKYQKVGDVLLTDESYNFTLEADSSFCKVLVKGPHHSANVWISKSFE